MCVFVSHLHVCVYVRVCESEGEYMSKAHGFTVKTSVCHCVCMSVCAHVHYMPHSFSLSSSRMGNSNNNHKTYFIFSVWGETTAFSLCHHFPTRSSNQITHTRTCVHTHIHTNPLVCSSASRGDCQSYYMECCLPCYIFTLWAESLPQSLNT